MADNDPAGLHRSYGSVRRTSCALCEPLAIEDHVVQAMADVSPPKWHLAHTTWFFETFVLEPFLPGYVPLEPAYRVLFNSYYQAVGAQHPRPRRGILSRPTVARVLAYRDHVDDHMAALLCDSRPQDPDAAAEIARRVVIGLHHEQQHQELMLMDTKYNFSCNPLLPAYREPVAEAAGHEPGPKLEWRAFSGGVIDIGYDGDGFCFDNELPRHKTLVHPFRMASRCVTNGEYLAFIEGGGYTDPSLWLSDGWAAVNQHGWRAPEYWRKQEDGSFHEFTLRGLRPLALDEPVVHVSYFEADAFARWSGKRLPSEQEWELAARSGHAGTGHFVESLRLHPAPASSASQQGLAQMFGDVWEWTSSPYVPYPGYRPLPGALGEYNGKFMCNQFVQRGGSCLTPESHIRTSYRNFFYPHQRWNTQGFRLAEDSP